jgi:hypothetical protein
MIENRCVRERKGSFAHALLYHGRAEITRNIFQNPAFFPANGINAINIRKNIDECF